MKRQLSRTASIVLGYLNSVRFELREFDIRDTIIVSGAPKSGTSWVGDIIACLPGYTVLFEPLNARWFSEVRQAGFEPRAYRSACEDWIQGEEYLGRILSGRVKTTAYSIRAVKGVLRGFLSSKIVAKFIRANRLIPWMSQHFPVRCTILLIRHPCAVIASQIRTGNCGYPTRYRRGGLGLPKPEDLIKEAQEIEYIDRAILSKLEHIQTVEEILAAIWCLDYYVPLFCPGPHPWITVVYERLLTEGADEVRRIFHLLGAETPQNAIRQLGIPSLSARIKSISTETQLHKWEKQLSSQQIRNIFEVLEWFGFDFYTENPEPHYDQLHRLI